MDAWGTGVYENDDAEELVDEVVGGGGLESLQASFARVLAVRESFLEAPEAAQALAAADIVSRLRRRIVPADSGVEELQLWLEDVDFFAEGVVVLAARRAVERVLTQPSELMELWTVNGALDEDWLQGVSRIVLRLE